MARSVSNLGDQMDKKFGVVGRTPANCDVHGPFEAVLLRSTGEPSGCPICARDKRETEELARKRSDFSRTQRSLARIPQRFASKTLAGYQVENDGQRVAVAACADYIDEFSRHRRAGRCMLLLGNVGTGKTHLGCAIVNTLIDQHMVKAIYRTVGTILGDIRETFANQITGAEAYIMRQLTDADLLVLDEVGATKKSEFELATLFSIINGRYEQGRPTVIISNLAPGELGDAIGTRCLDRVRENACIGVAFDWESYRGREAAQ